MTLRCRHIKPDPVPSASSFIKLSHTKSIFPCPKSPRAQDWTTRDHVYSPEPDEIIQTFNPVLTVRPYPASPIAPEKTPVKAVAHASSLLTSPGTALVALCGLARHPPLGNC